MEVLKDFEKDYKDNLFTDLPISQVDYDLLIEQKHNQIISFENEKEVDYLEDKKIVLVAKIYFFVIGKKHLEDTIFFIFINKEHFNTKIPCSKATKQVFLVLTVIFVQLKVVLVENYLAVNKNYYI